MFGFPLFCFFFFISISYWLSFTKRKNISSIRTGSWHWSKHWSHLLWHLWFIFRWIYFTWFYRGIMFVTTSDTLSLLLTTLSLLTFSNAWTNRTYYKSNSNSNTRLANSYDTWPNQTKAHYQRRASFTKRNCAGYGGMGEACGDIVSLPLHPQPLNRLPYDVRGGFVKTCWRWWFWLGLVIVSLWFG